MAVVLHIEIAASLANLSNWQSCAITRRMSAVMGANGGTTHYSNDEWSDNSYKYVCWAVDKWHVVILFACNECVACFDFKIERVLLAEYVL